MAVIASDHLTRVGWHGHGLGHMPRPWTGCYIFTLPILSIDNNNKIIFIVICHDLCCKHRRWTMSTSYFHINYVPRKKKITCNKQQKKHKDGPPLGHEFVNDYHRLLQSAIQ